MVTVLGKLRNVCENKLNQSETISYANAVIGSFEVTYHMLYDDSKHDIVEDEQLKIQNKDVCIEIDPRYTSDISKDIANIFVAFKENGISIKKEIEKHLRHCKANNCSDLPFICNVQIDKHLCDIILFTHNVDEPLVTMHVEKSNKRDDEVHPIISISAGYNDCIFSLTDEELEKQCLAAVDVLYIEVPE